MAKKPDSGWQKVDVPYVTKVAGVEAESVDGDLLDLPQDPFATIFIRTENGEKWSADHFCGYFLKTTGTEIQDHVPSAIIKGDIQTVGLPVTLTPGSFYVETDEGPIDLALVKVLVEFHPRKH